MDVTNLTGLEKPLTKLVETVSAGIGTLYRPHAIKKEADAKAYEIRTLAQAQAEVEVNTKSYTLQADINRINQLAGSNPELLERAKQRLLLREIEGQQNVETIVEQAVLALPNKVDDTPVSSDWRRKFFLEAENICEEQLQIVWGKILAGEVAAPGTFSIRTLETLRALSRDEAELFQKACAITMKEGFIVLPGNDINTALIHYGLSFDVIQDLRDAGLLQYGENTYVGLAPSIPELDFVSLENNGIHLQVAGPFEAVPFKQGCLFFTKAGRELQSLIAANPNEDYLKTLGATLKPRGFTLKRGKVTKVENGELISFEEVL